MIPSTSFQMNDDGTAWWVVPDEDHLPQMWERPCDTCGGSRGFHGRMGHYPCVPCDGTGRHTFTVEVDNRLWMEGNYIDGYIVPHRVSVVPGMVLPIVKRQPISHYSALDEGDIIRVVQRALPVPGGVIVEYTNHSGQVVDSITLPPDAEPRKWAVRLAVHA